MKTYAASVERDGGFWLIHVTGDGFDYYTQARRLADVEHMARDLIATVLEVDPASFDLGWSVTLPASVREHLARASQLRQESERANHEAAMESRRAARELKSEGLTVRDIGEALGISYQRAHQLVS